MENNEVPKVETTSTKEDLQKEIENVKAQKEELLSTQQEVNKLQEELAKQKAELEELKNYKFPSAPTPEVVVQDSEEMQLEKLKAEFDRYLVDKSAMLPSPISRDFWKTEAYETYRHLAPEERTIWKLKQILGAK